MAEQKLTLRDLLRNGSIRIINKETEAGYLQDVLDANGWEDETENGKDVYEYNVSDDSENVDANDLSGFVAQVSSIEEFVNSANFELEALSEKDVEGEQEEPKE